MVACACGLLLLNAGGGSRVTLPDVHAAFGLTQLADAEIAHPATTIAMVLYYSKCSYSRCYCLCLYHKSGAALSSAYTEVSHMRAALRQSCCD